MEGGRNFKVFALFVRGLETMSVEPSGGLEVLIGKSEFMERWEVVRR